MRSVLAVAAYPGDVESGCGGTVAAHRAAGDAVTVLVLSGSGSETAARALDCLLVHGKLDPTDTGPQIVAAIETVLTGVDADVIYLPAPEDTDPLRRAVATAALAAGRHGRRVLHYGGPASWRFEPSVFVDVTESLPAKLAVVADPETATASARHFGALARVRYAEAFQPARFVWDL